MNKNRVFLVGGGIVLIVIVSAFVFFTQKPAETTNSEVKTTVTPTTITTVAEQPSDAATPTETITAKGVYTDYSASKLTDQTNILFFWASWCPTCKILNDSINTNIGSIPSGVTIFKTNYDTETALRQKYGVTYQHTLVQVDKNGNMIKKWTNSPSLNDVISQIKR